MPFNWGLLSQESLSNQPQEVQQGLQEQATKQFLLNTLFGGGVMSGLRAAQAVPEQYQTAVEQRAFDRAVANARRQATEPVMGEAAGPSMPGEAPPQMVVGQRLNPEQFLTQLPAVVAQAGPRARTGNVKEFADLFGKTANQIKDGFIVSPGGNIVGIAPRIDTKEGTFVTGQMVNGQPSLQMAPIQGAIQTRALMTLPELNRGEEYVFDRQGNVTGIRNVAGAVQSLAEREGAQAAAREANIPRPGFTQSGAPTFNFVTPPGLRAMQPAIPAAGGTTAPAQGAQTQPQATGGTAFGPSTAQAAVNAAYEPILKDAYAGFKLASGRSSTLQSLRNALSNPNFDTNAFTPAKTALTGFLNATGVTGQNANQFLTNASAFRQGLNTIAAQSVSELPGAISNFELQFAQSRFGTMTDPKTANLYAIDLMEVADKRKRDYYNFVQKNPRSDVIDAWQNSPQGRQGIFEDPKLRKYLPQRPVASGPNKGKTAYNLPSGEWVVFD